MRKTGSLGIDRRFFRAAWHLRSSEYQAWQHKAAIWAQKNTSFKVSSCACMKFGYNFKHDYYSMGKIPCKSQSCASLGESCARFMPAKNKIGTSVKFYVVSIECSIKVCYYRGEEHTFEPNKLV